MNFGKKKVDPLRPLWGHVRPSALGLDGQMVADVHRNGEGKTNTKSNVENE